MCRDRQRGKCENEACRYKHGWGGGVGVNDDGYGNVVDVERQLTEARLTMAFEEMRGSRWRQDESEGEDVDVDVDEDEDEDEDVDVETGVVC